MNEHKQNNKKELIFLATIFIIFGCVMRLLPHPANFAPITAIALFGGFYLDKKYALSLPLLAMFMSDLFLDGYNWTIRVAVYGSFLLVGLTALALKKHKSWQTILGSTILGSIIFYLITNAAVWWFTPLYANTFSGLIQSYYLALPFFRNSLVGNVFYVTVFFGSYELIRFYIYKFQQKTAQISK